MLIIRIRSGLKVGRKGVQHLLDLPIIKTLPSQQGDQEHPVLAAEEGKNRRKSVRCMQFL